MKGDSVEKLIRRAGNGDGDAFVELMDLHKQSMYKVAKAYLKQEEDVADAISETILDCFEHLTDLKEPRYFGTWLVRILMNNCSGIRKKRQRLGSTDQIDIFEQRMAKEDENTQAFLDYLEPLDREDRTLMILFYVWGFKTREISELLHIKEPTVKSRLQRSRSKIKKEFFPMIV